MKRRTFSQAIALGTLVCAAPSLFAQPAQTAGAASSAPVMAPDDMRAELNELLPDYRLIGKQRLTYWGFRVYDARLWALPGFKKDNLAGQPFALELAYLRDFDAIDVAERSITEMRRSATISETQAKTWTAEMMLVYPDFKKGDRVMGINKPGVGAAYMVNGKSTGEIRDVEFARLFFGIWLSPQTSQPKLRSALLAGAA
jgi:hypothetical protein